MDSHVISMCLSLNGNFIGPLYNPSYLTTMVAKSYEYKDPCNVNSKINQNTTILPYRSN